MSKRAFRSSSNGLRVANEDDLRIAELVIDTPFAMEQNAFSIPEPESMGK
jgi:hypothetical protein